MSLRDHDIRLVPSPLWGASLAALSTAKTWDTIRKDVEEKAGCRCQFQADPGFHRSGPLHGHERWRYENGTATLEAIWSICGSCHDMLHPGRVLASGGLDAYQRIRDAYSRRCDIPAITAEGRYRKAFEIHQELSEIRSWLIDVSLVSASMPLRAKKGGIPTIRKHRWIGMPFGPETHGDAHGSSP